MFEMWWVLSLALPLVLIIVAIVSLARKSRMHTALENLGWAALIILIPILGAVLWLAVGARSRQSVVES